MLEKGSLVLVYPYNTAELTDDQKLSIPHYYRQGSGANMQYYMEGTVSEDEGGEFTIMRKDDGGAFTSQWEDIYKVVIKLNALGLKPTKSGQTIYAPGRSQPGDEGFIGPMFGGDTGTDKAKKDGMTTYLILAVCAVGIVLYIK